MAEAATLPEITVAAAKPDDTDYLTPALAKVFATYGQDTTTPAVQAEIATTAQRLRDTNPDADDKTLVTQLSANLPQVISSVSQTPRVSSGADEQAQLASYKQQVQKDAANAGLNTITAYGFKGNAGNDYVKNMQDLSFNPSSALMSQIKADDQFYKNQQSKGLAQETAEKAAQAGIKTISDRQQLAQTQNLLDPTSDQNQSLREALTQQLKQMGAPASAIARMANMNAVQMKLFADGFANTEKERASINLTTQQALTQKAMQASNYASANASNAQAGKTKEETQGVKSENIIKKFKADSITANGGAGAPEAIATEVMPAGKNSVRQDNQHAAAVMNASAPQVADIQQTAQTLLNEMNSGASTGYIQAKFKALSSTIQSVNKNLNALQASQQGGGGGTAAQADAIAGANPDASYNPDVIKQYLLSTLGSVARQNLVRDKTLEAVKAGQHGDFERGKYAASLTPLAVIQNGKIVSVEAYEPGELVGATNALRSRYPGAYVGPVSSTPLPKVGK